MESKRAEIKKELISLIVDQLVDSAHPNAAEATAWVETQAGKASPACVNGLIAILWIGHKAMKDDGYSRRDAELIWRHIQKNALEVLVAEAGEKGKPFPPGLHVSPKPQKVKFQQN